MRRSRRASILRQSRLPRRSPLRGQPLAFPMHLPDEPLRAQLGTMETCRSPKASRTYEAFRSLIQRGLLTCPNRRRRPDRRKKAQNSATTIQGENEIHSAIVAALAAGGLCFAASRPSRRRSLWKNSWCRQGTPASGSTCATSAPRARRSSLRRRSPPLLFVHGATYPAGPRSTCG